MLVVNAHKGLHDLHYSPLDVTVCALSAKRKLDIRYEQTLKVSATSSLSRNMLTSFTLARKSFAALRVYVLGYLLYTMSATAFLQRCTCNLPTASAPQIVQSANESYELIGCVK